MYMSTHVRMLVLHVRTLQNCMSSVQNCMSSVYITYVQVYVRLNICINCTCVIPVAPSVTEAMATLVTPNDNITEHSITVTCTDHPDSDADMCVVMVMAVGRTTREGIYMPNE